MTVTSIKRRKGRADRLNVYIDGDLAISLAREVAVRNHIRVGAEIDSAALQKLAAENERWRAREAALSLLWYRPRSRAEIRTKLRSRGFEESAIEEALAKLEASGLVDDDSFARTLVRDRLRRKPSGRLRLRSVLRAKGVAAEVIEQVLDEALGASDGAEVELARQAARSIRPRSGEDPQRFRRRLYGFLGRRGFPGAVISEVMNDPDPAEP